MYLVSGLAVKMHFAKTLNMVSTVFMPQLGHDALAVNNGVSLLPYPRLTLLQSGRNYYFLIASEMLFCNQFLKPDERNFCFFL
jgi:hypothetical protein